MLQLKYLRPMYTLSEINIYPIKSLGGISLKESTVEIRGLQYDRRWMLVNEQGRFMSQREIPEMALLRTEISGDQLQVYHINSPNNRLGIPLSEPQPDLEKVNVEIWSDKCSAHVLPEDISIWFSHTLKSNLRLVQMPESTHRHTDGRYAPAGHYVSFADGFPFLIIGQSTLDDLNERMETPLPMNRFRPNFVFTGGDPLDEENWSDFTIGSIPFRAVKPCARCIIPTIDQETGTQKQEPLKTLSTYRQFGKKICFGQNVIWMGEGEAVVRVGDALRIMNYEL